MKNFITHALEIKGSTSLTHKEMVENNFIGRGLVFFYNGDKTFDIVSTNTRCFIVKRNVELKDFDVEKDFLIDLEILKKDVDFKKFMKSNNIVDFIYSLENNKKEFDFDIFKNKYTNLKERLKLYSTITEENKIVPVYFSKAFETTPIQDFIRTLKTSEFFDRGKLTFNNDGVFYTKHNFKTEMEYVIDDFDYFSSKKQPEYSISFSEYSYLSFPVYDFMKGFIYKVDNSQLMYLKCFMGSEKEYDFYVIEG